MITFTATPVTLSGSQCLALKRANVGLLVRLLSSSTQLDQFPVQDSDFVTPQQSQQYSEMSS